MRDITVLLMPLQDGFRAVAGATALDSYSLDTFGTRIEQALKKNVGEDIDVEYALSNDLKPRFATCPVCHGAERVEVEGTIAGQTLQSVYSSIDFSKRATDTCPRCKGLGVDIPRFWEPLPLSA